MNEVNCTVNIEKYKRYNALRLLHPTVRIILNIY